MGASGGSETVGTYSAPIGFIFIFNIIVGTGALTMPKAFGEAGWVLSSVVLVILGIVSYMTVSFMIEAMSTGNAIRCVSSNENGDSLGERLVDEESPLIVNTGNEAEGESIFEIKKQLEMAHLSQMFFNKIGVVLFYLSICIYLFGDLTIYAAAAPKSARDVACTYEPPPINQNFSVTDYEGDTDYLDSKMVPVTNTSTDIDSSRCWENVNLSRNQVYKIFVGCFFLLLGPFVFFNVSKTKYIQIFTSFLRWFSFGIMLILTSIRLAKGEGLGHPPQVDFKGVPNLFGICVYSFMCHHSLPALITPIKKKSQLSAILLSNYVLILVFYLALALTEVFSFRVLMDLCTLNFQPNHDTPITNVAFFQYFLALFPAFTLSTNFPILAITLRNTITHLFSPLLRGLPPILPRILIPIIVLIPPCAISMSTDNVGMLVGLTGSYAGVAIQYIIPSFLVLYARRHIRGYLPLNIEFDTRFKQKHRSIFSHWIWPVMVIIWSLFVYIIVTYYNIMKY